VWLLTPHQQATPDPVAAAPKAAPVAAVPTLAAVPPAAVVEAPTISSEAAMPAAPASAPGKPRAEPARTVAKTKAPAKDKAPAAATEPAPVAAAAPGLLQLAVTPWGQVEVDGRAMGTTPPLTRLTLPAGAHQVVVRNGDFPAHTGNVTVGEDKPVTLRHRFE
jgi:eukaryotic-like serine/threonine-protein kinase